MLQELSVGIGNKPATLPSLKEIEEFLKLKQLTAAISSSQEPVKIGHTVIGSKKNRSKPEAVLHAKTSTKPPFGVVHRRVLSKPSVGGLTS